MMKKLVTFMLAVVMVMVATLLPTQAFAANPYQDYDRIYSINKKLVDNERTDVYALDFFSFSPSVDWASIYPEQSKVVKEIIKGITDDYAKVKAIFEWIHKNKSYIAENDAVGLFTGIGVSEESRGNCKQYAKITELFYRLAGFPAKYIEGMVKNLGGLAKNHGIQLLNSVGVIDSDFRGEVGALLYNTGVTGKAFTVEPYDRVAQCIFIRAEEVVLVEQDALSETARGEGGYNSTGVK